MKRALLFFIATLVITAISQPVSASDIDDAIYQGTITISNNGTTATNVATVCAINGTALQNVYGVDSDYNYVAIRNSSGVVRFMPGVNSTVPWSLFVPSIGEVSSLTYTLYTGESSLNATKYYFPGSGGMTVADDAEMECGDNFTLNLNDTWVNTDSSTNITRKVNALYLYTGSGNITAHTYSGTWNNPSSYTDTDSQWSSETNIYDDDTGTYATESTVASGSWSSYINLSFTAQRVNSIRYQASRETSYTNVTISIDIYSGGQWISVVNNGGIASGWNTVYMAKPYYSDTIRIRMYNSFGSASDMYLNEIDVSPAIFVSAAVESGEHDIELAADSTNFTLSIDGVVESTMGLSGASVPDNSNNWAVGSSSTFYIGTFNLAVDGTDVCTLAWENDTTFHDSSGNGNDGTPTFRITSGDADVSAVLSNFQPINEAEVPTFDLSESDTILSGNATSPDEMYTELDFDVLPVDPINDILDEGEIPRSLWWFPFLFIGIGIVGMLSYGATTIVRGPSNTLQTGQIDGSLLTMCLIVEVLLVLLGIMGPIPLWPAFLFPIPAIALIISRKHYSWG